MHAAGKVLLILGLIITLIGGAIMAWSSDTVDNAVDDMEENNWAIEDATGGEIEIVDDDGMGELGFTIYIEGIYSDDNENRVWDHCESYDQNSNQTNFTTTHTDDSENSFYYACDMDWYGEDKREEGNKNLVKIGDSASGYENGTATVSCATACWVQYDDKALGEFIGDIGEVASGFMAGLGSMCILGCGITLLVIGGILALTLKSGDGGQQVVIQQSPQVAGMMMNQPMQTQMSQPVYQQPQTYQAPPQTGIEPPQGGL
ncbi:MAG: hypothetical protein QGI21_01850 [Candidatus Poseidoniaceae archaeon]|jgi:hypothetical protein|nr:hypothetical protein [Candidatus Poseidoniaceae archaeon]